jgi:hypothetical protein
MLLRQIPQIGLPANAVQMLPNLPVEPTDHVITWRSKVNGRAATGTKLFTKNEAEKLAAELNEDHPEIEHTAIKSDAKRAK